MFTMEDDLELIWNGILSEEKNLIIDTFKELSDIDKKTVTAHLKKNDL